MMNFSTWRTIGSRLAVLATIAILMGRMSSGQQAPAPAASGDPSAETATSGTAGTTIDQVIAVVNGDLVLESDVDEERRFGAFQPLTSPTGFSRDRAIERLINRDLILQQAKLQPGDQVKAPAVAEQIQALRKDIPACKRYACETDAGWAKFLADQGFTASELQQRWMDRMQVLAYIENRFRQGIRISPEEIKAYYDKTLLPEYAKEKAPAPRLADLSDRIQEILLQQQVGKLLQDWLKSLRAQGTVQIMKPGEVAP